MKTRNSAWILAKKILRGNWQMMPTNKESGIYKLFNINSLASLKNVSNNKDNNDNCLKKSNKTYFL